MDLTENQASTGIEIEGLRIRNDLLFSVTDVMILVPVSGDYVGCGIILPRSECSTTFPVRDYRGSAVVISWKEYGEAHKTDEFVVDVPDGIDPELPAMVEVIIYTQGLAGARLVQ
jgi:hypothetical protein